VALRIMASAAVVCLLAGGGYALTRMGSGSTSSAAASSASAGKPKYEKAAGQAGSAITGGPVHAGTNGGSASSSSVAFSAIASGTDYQPGQQLLQQVESELSNHVAAKPYTVTTALSDCVAKVAGGWTPAMVDVARYQGQTATIIVVTHPSASGKAWVVNAGCTRKLAETVLPAAG
jgi:hypothetical protein